MKRFATPQFIICLELDAAILASSFLFPSWRREAGEIDDFLTSIFSTTLIH